MFNQIHAKLKKYIFPLNICQAKGFLEINQAWNFFVKIGNIK